jgi:hypothetical protein
MNSDKYKELLAEYQPKLIRNEEENEKALASTCHSTNLLWLKISASQ